ncbi:MAG TPA: NAD-binding protein [Longimicrobiales bacterium]|nr:NAD-binding protein [Longimicrobiales bacterium]
MKFVSTQIAYFLSQGETRRNIGALVRYLVFLALVIIAYSAIFHVLMAMEGQDHSWLTGVYWTLTVMSTLGFGDITFTSDLGRVFSTLVLLSGILLLLVLLPFIFIRFFYAPWLETRIQQRAPRRVPPGTAGHVILCSWDAIAPELARRLRLHHVPWFVLETDPVRAGQMHADGLPVVTGATDDVDTYRALLTEHAAMVVANLDDPANTNITLTVREVAPEVPVVAIATDEDAVDVLGLSGATHVLPLRRQLGEQLANRINAGHTQCHVIGRFHDLLIGEFPVHNTPFRNRTVRATGLRRATGVSIVGIWERGRLQPAHPDAMLTDASVPVVVGTQAQIDALNELLIIYDANFNPVVVIGGGRVGRAAAATLKRGGVSVHLVEKRPEMAPRLEGITDRFFIGDAADRRVLEEAGIHEAPSVLLTTHDDAINIYLAVYCRRLNPELRIVSRITHERNIAAVIRAGADLVLSYAALGAEAITAILKQRELVLLGAGFDLFRVNVPATLVGLTLGESEIGARTGASIIAIQTPDDFLPNPAADLRLEADMELIAVANADQREAFQRHFS